jgi:hypothetical protein
MGEAQLHYSLRKGIIAVLDKVETEHRESVIYILDLMTIIPRIKVPLVNVIEGSTEFHILFDPLNIINYININYIFLAN